MTPVGPDDLLTFGCGPELPCFNECCRDLNQSLMPYDILRLKRNVGMTSHDFLRRYTSLHIGPDSGLPVVSFKPDPDTGNACPFVTSKGCSVYPDRPASCRMYPLARAIARSRESGEVVEYFALIEEAHCQGFGRRDGQTVRSWLAGQDVEKHNMMNDKLMGIIALKNQIMPGRLDGAQADRFYLALYDLDTFRREIFEKGFLDGLGIPEDLLSRVREDDEALLELGIAWIKHDLFGRTMVFPE